MVNFEEAQHKAFEALTEIVSVSLLSETDKNSAGLNKYSCVLRISTEIFVSDSNIRPVNLLMALPDDFPLVLPKIYISKEDKKWIGFIPHVNVAGYICLYDEEAIVLNADHPGEIVGLCFKQALKIIEQGLKACSQNDFSDEFVAYWAEKYDEKDKIHAGLTMLEQVPDNPPCSIKFLFIKGPYFVYKTVLYDQGKSIKRFKDFLNNKSYSTIEREGLYLGSVTGLRPPFNFTNSNVYKIVKDHFPHSKKEFEKFINRKIEYHLVVFSVISGADHLFFGWYIKALNTNRNGFRKGVLTPLYIFNNFQKGDRVIRLQFDTYTNERISKRTDGVMLTEKYTITFAGLGSIGSNLIPCLMPIGIDTLHLIDPETLSLANINRHLLGPYDIGEAKVEAVRNYLLNDNPLIEIFAHKESVIHYIRNKCETLNNSNYLFIVIGKNTIERYILEALHEDHIKVPTFFIWIEPYLIGGHCLYIQPGHQLEYHELYQNNLFKYNVIDSSEYNNPQKQILLREAGCQGSYMPYGQKNITLFLSSLLPNLYHIIDDKSKRNCILTWKGKIPNHITMELSDYGRQLNEGVIQLKEL